MTGVGRVGADRDASGADDGKGEQRVEERVEAVDADGIAALEARGVEAGDEVLDCGFCGFVRVVDGWVVGID